MSKSTEGNMRVLREIHEYQVLYGRSATFRELTVLTGYASTSTIARHVIDLQEMGYVAPVSKGEPRSLVITTSGLQAIESS